MLIKSVCSLAVGQNGHWRATDTTFDEQKDANGNVISWDVETFNMVWVYDTNTKRSQDVATINNYYTEVGYTGDNIPNVDDKTVIDYAHWTTEDKNGKSAYLPWIYWKDVTIQAWYWDDSITSESIFNNYKSGTYNLEKSPIRIESYVGGDNTATFARGAGDNDGRWA